LRQPQIICSIASLSRNKEQNTAAIFKMKPTKSENMMEPRTRLADIFGSLGLHQPRPTDAQLGKWGMSAKRFTQLFKNQGNNPITVPEARALRAWLEEHFTGSHVYLFEDDVPAQQRHKAAQQELQLR
jgi:hypothetical protein